VYLDVDEGMKEPTGTNGTADSGETSVNTIARSAVGTLGTTERSGDTERYLQSCRTEFWRNVFRVELEYLLQHLGGSREMLSVGCGPAIIESGLSERGFRVTGLDVSEEALACAPDHIRTIAGRAEDMDFPKSSFDAVIYVASLQFIEDYRRAMEKTAQVLRPAGKLIVMLLNPQSAFYKEKTGDPTSYVRKIRHTSLQEIESVIAEYFHTQTEYFMGVKDGNIYRSRATAEASLYVIRGRRKHLREDGEA
jgi:ubiquinone/menaquinone biosynthesis C-methylase UbiE